MKKLPKRNGNTSKHLARRSPEKRYIRQAVAREFAELGIARRTKPKSGAMEP